MYIGKLEILETMYEVLETVCPWETVTDEKHQAALPIYYDGIRTMTEALLDRLERAEKAMAERVKEYSTKKAEEAEAAE